MRVARHARRRRRLRPAATRSGSTPLGAQRRARPQLDRRARVTDRDAFDLLPHIFPVRGRHNFGQRGARFGAGRGGRSHQGQDVMAKCGTRMVAARGGKVKAKAYHRAAGNYLVITGSRTGQDYVYMHLTEPSAFDKGDRVLTGQRIGTVGDTGNARGCHLHFELWRKRRLVQRRPPVQPPPCAAGVGLLLLAAGQPAQAGEEPADPGGVGRVAARRGWRAGRAPRPAGSGSPGRRAGRSQPTTAITLGTSRASPIEVGIMPLKIGLRTMANGPSVTRSVRSSGSTPMRHERPIAIWATSVLSRPSREQAHSRRRDPTAPSSASIGSITSSRSATGAATPISSATTNSTPPIHSADPRRPLMPLKPDEPVRRSWIAVRRPKASAP